MANVLDVAAYILKTTGPISAWKLQKLVYYSQAWTVTWRDTALFDNRVEAWANGPVCPDLYARHRGSFKVGCIAGGDASALNPVEAGDVKNVVDFYSKYSGQQLTRIIHQPNPISSGREGLAVLTGMT